MRCVNNVGRIRRHLFGQWSLYRIESCNFGNFLLVAEDVYLDIVVERTTQLTAEFTHEWLIYEHTGCSITVLWNVL